MAQKRTLNQRRLTKRQVKELISSGALPRPDLSVALEPTSLQQSVYELEGERYLVVFGKTVAGLAGKGDIYAADVFHGFARWLAKGWRRRQARAPKLRRALGVPFGAQTSSDRKYRPAGRPAPFDDVEDERRTRPLVSKP